MQSDIAFSVLAQTGQNVCDKCLKFSIDVYAMKYLISILSIGFLPSDINIFDKCPLLVFMP